MARFGLGVFRHGRRLGGAALNDAARAQPVIKAFGQQMQIKGIREAKSSLRPASYRFAYKNAKRMR